MYKPTNWVAALQPAALVLLGNHMQQYNYNVTGVRVPVAIVRVPIYYMTVLSGYL